MIDNLQEMEINAHSVPQPTAEQLARAAARKSFDRRYVYLPLGMVSFFWVLTLLAMLWLAVFSALFPTDINQEFFRLLFSGVADIILIWLISFWLLLGTIPIGLTVYIWWKRREIRQNRPPGPDPLPIIWRLENFVVLISDRIIVTLPLIARPVVLAYAIAGYFRGLFLEVKKIVTRSS